MISWKVQQENFCAKIKNFKFGPKKPFLSILDWNLKKLMPYLKSTPSILSKYQVSSKTTTITATTKNGAKHTLFGYFGARILKNYCHIWNQHLRICLLAKFHKKTKIPKFGTKNAWFIYFGAGIWKQFYHIWNQHRRICLIAKFCGKTKMPYLGIFDQKCFIWLFLG